MYFFADFHGYLDCLSLDAVHLLISTHDAYTRRVYVGQICIYGQCVHLCVPYVPPYVCFLQTSQ